MTEKIGVVATLIATVIAVLTYFSITPGGDKPQSPPPSSSPAMAAIDQRLAQVRQIGAGPERDRALSEVVNQALQADLPRKALEITGMMESATMKDRALDRIVSHAISRRDYKLAEDSAKAISHPALRDGAMKKIVERQR